MANKLVIVESPTKARTIGRMLSKDYRIMASVGHIRDLPERSLGIDIKNKYQPLYVETPRSKKVISGLRTAAKEAEAIFLASDPDREGEAIAWHLQETLKKQCKGDFKRVTFHEITKTAIDRAFDHTTSVNMNLVNAQQARRVLDRIVGYKVSPLLWSQITRGTSAGRVQTVALRLIVEREREIQAFKPEEYWNFTLLLEADNDQFEARLFKIDDEKFKIGSAADAEAAMDAVLNGNGFKVNNITFTERRRNAPPPFTTSTMQQTANNLLHFSAAGTMRLAQQLYEGVSLGAGDATGLITYMRTDSVNVAREAVASCRKLIANNFGDEYVPEKPNFFKSKSGAQEAHEAIRPTDVFRTPESVAPFLEAQQLKLYTLIWNRFVASQMARGIQRQTMVDIITRGADNKAYTFRANALITIFPGFMRVFGNVNKQDAEQHAEVLGRLREQNQCSLVKADKEQKFTEPPPRYSEAALIKELEQNGVGRPSTYATIMRTIQLRRYVNRDQGRLIPSELGFNVCDFLIRILPKLFDVGFTSSMESQLDAIEEGKIEWTQMLDEFYCYFSDWLTQAKKSDAPDTDKVRALLEQLDYIKEWEPGQKRGRRVYDDKKFYNSVKEKFSRDQLLSAKQWEAILKLAVKYREQLSDLFRVAEQHGFDADIQRALAAYDDAVEQAERNAPSAAEVADYRLIVQAFDGVPWEEPVASKGRTYDDKKLFTSFNKQVEAGRKLSEKQLNVLRRFALKYRESVNNFNQLCGLLNIDLTKAEQQQQEQSGQNEEAARLIANLDNVTEWSKPTKKGKRVFDDKSFFKSLSDQFKSGRQLSPKQLFALKKLAAKYLKVNK